MGRGWLEGAPGAIFGRGGRGWLEGVPGGVLVGGGTWLVLNVGLSWSYSLQ